MYINKLSVSFTLIVFTISIILFSYLRRNMQRFNIGLKTLSFVLTLMLIRLFLPFEFYDSIDLKSRRLYPFLGRIGRYEFVKLDIDLLELLVVIWFVGFLVLLAWDIFKTRQFRVHLDSLENKITDEEIQLYRTLVEKLEIKNPPKLIKAEGIQSPFTIGVIRSEIFIGNITYDKEHLTYILVHEFIHYKSFDNFKKFILVLLSRFFWWNPFVKYLVDDINQLIEIKCDSKLLTYLPDRNKYIEAIVEQIKNSLTIYRQENLSVSYFVPSKIDNIKQRLCLIEREKPAQDYSSILMTISITLFIISYFFIVIPFNLPVGISHEAGFMKVTREEREVYIQDEFNMKRDFFDKYICDVKQ